MTKYRVAFFIDDSMQHSHQRDMDLNLVETNASMFLDSYPSFTHAIITDEDDPAFSRRVDRRAEAG